MDKIDSITGTEKGNRFIYALNVFTKVINTQFSLIHTVKDIYFCFSSIVSRIMMQKTACKSSDKFSSYSDLNLNGFDLLSK